MTLGVSFEKNIIIKINAICCSVFSVHCRRFLPDARSRSTGGTRSRKRRRKTSGLSWKFAKDTEGERLHWNECCGQQTSHWWDIYSLIRKINNDCGREDTSSEEEDLMSGSHLKQALPTIVAATSVRAYRLPNRCSRNGQHHHKRGEHTPLKSANIVRRRERFVVFL